MTANTYRQNAQECLRIAQTVEDERERPFWVTMAQSWLRLAEQAAAHPPKIEAEYDSFDNRVR